LTIYNGSNEVQVLKAFSSLPTRIAYVHIENQTLNNLIILEQRVNKTPPHGFILKAGNKNVALNREFATYAVRDRRAKDLLEWVKFAWAPEEMLLSYF
jgi:hypothetical protein